MQDPRIDFLAKQVIEFSVSLKKGEKVLIDVWDDAVDFATALVKAAQNVGGLPFVNLQSQTVQRAWIMRGTRETFEAWYGYEANRMSDMDAYIVVRKQDNNSELSDVPAAQLNLYNEYSGKLHYGIRLPKTKWCVLRYPSASMAQAAGMSTEAFEDFYFKCCCLDYRRLNELLKPLAVRMHNADRVRIVGPDTDLSFSIKDCRHDYGSCGIWNIPCGECGMPIVQGTANGTIHYNMPSMFQGTVFNDIRLTLKDGRIIEATSDHTELMNKILDVDHNARQIGEFALGLNPFVTCPILDTLFDEKMCMSLHFTPGNSRNNPSSIHWDIVTSHAKECGGGEIWVDGELIRKDGLFVPEDLQPLNPESLRAEVKPAFAD